jgi:F0F1-type ATP synthase assembly protein I
MKSPPISMPDHTRPRRAKDARSRSTGPHSPSPGLKWPGLTTAQSLAVASQFGVSLAVGVGLGLVAGQWLDGQAHTGFLFTLLGVFAGLILGMSSVVALYRATLRSSEREWREESAGKGKSTRP